MLRDRLPTAPKYVQTKFRASSKGYPGKAALENGSSWLDGLSREQLPTCGEHFLQPSLQAFLHHGEETHLSLSKSVPAGLALLTLSPSTSQSALSPLWVPAE